MNTQDEANLRDEIGPIPEGWDVVKFGDVRESLQYGTSLRCGYEPSEFAVLRIPNIEPGCVNTEDLKYGQLSPDEADRYRLEKGDLIFIRTNGVIERLGSCAVFEGEPKSALFASYLIRARLKLDLIDPHFAAYFFASKRGSRIIAGRATPAADGKYNLNTSTIDSLPLPLPPTLVEQRAIAAALTKVRETIAINDSCAALTTKLKHAATQALFTRGLYGTSQKETEIGPIPENWTIHECEELARRITVGVVVRPASYYVPVGVPAFRSFNVREDRLETSDLVYFSEAANDGPLKKSRLSKGDVLVVRTGYPGTSCVVPEEFDGANCIDIAIITPDHYRILPGYLSRFLNSESGKRQALASSHGLAQQHLNISALKRVKLPLPPALREQEEILEILDAIDLKINLHRRKRELLKQLFESLLHALMNGDLRLTDLDLSALMTKSDGGEVAA